MTSLVAVRINLNAKGPHWLQDLARVPLVHAVINHCLSYCRKCMGVADSINNGSVLFK